jgi:hypothetical protein
MPAYKHCYNIMFAQNIGIPEQLIRDNIAGCASLVPMNTSITWQLVQDTRDQVQWDYAFMGQFLCISCEIIKENKQLPWDIKYISANPNITWSDIQSSPDLAWDFAALSHGNRIKWSDIQSHHEHAWNYAYMSSNPIITHDIIMANPDKPWNLDYFIWNPNVTWEFIEEHPEIPWVYKSLTINPNISIEIIRGNPDRGWCPYYLAQRMEWHDLEKHAHVVQLHDAHINVDAFVLHMMKNPNIFNVESELRPYNAAAFTIQRAWRNAISNPSMRVCKTRIMREFEEFPQ